MTKLITKVQAYLATREQDEEGAGMVEYGLLVTLIALAATLAMTSLGGRIGAMFDSITF